MLFASGSSVRRRPKSETTSRPSLHAQHVLRRHVPVDDARGVDGGEPLGDGARVGEPRREGRAAAASRTISLGTSGTRAP